MLWATAQLDGNIMGEILEETEDVDRIREEVSKKLLNRLADVNAGEGSIAELFETLDDDGSGEVSLTELRSGLEKMDVYMSKAQYKRFFKAVDVNKDRMISQQEFIWFLYPEKKLKHEQSIHKLKTFDGVAMAAALKNVVAADVPEAVAEGDAAAETKEEA